MAKRRKKKVESTEKEKPQNPNGLRTKQLAFANAYLETGNKRKAAIIAGYAEKSAGIEGCRLYAHPKVQAYLQKMHSQTQALAVRSRVDLAEDARRIWQTAYEQGEYDTALKGVEVEAKLLGLLDDIQRHQQQTSITIAWQSAPTPETVPAIDITPN